MSQKNKITIGINGERHYYCITIIILKVVFVFICLG